MYELVIRVFAIGTCRAPLVLLIWCFLRTPQPSEPSLRFLIEICEGKENRNYNHYSLLIVMSKIDWYTSMVWPWETINVNEVGIVWFPYPLNRRRAPQFEQFHWDHWVVISPHLEVDRFLEYFHPFLLLSCSVVCVIGCRRSYNQYSYVKEHWENETESHNWAEESVVELIIVKIQ